MAWHRMEWNEKYKNIRLGENDDRAQMKSYISTATDENRK